mmetsp:Transcript_31549/g.84250  ORF Transcript_31549/g.84250 Transcript_31549/m.84250 type:complete len:209 (+) Transcript_31549:621-1247(+)
MCLRCVPQNPFSDSGQSGTEGQVVKETLSHIHRQQGVSNRTSPQRHAILNTRHTVAVTSLEIVDWGQRPPCVFRGNQFKVRDAVQTREGDGGEAAVLPAFISHAAGIAVQQESRFLEFLICMQAEDNTPRMIQVLRRAESPPVKSSHVHLKEETHVVGIQPLIVWHHHCATLKDVTEFNVQLKLTYAELFHTGVAHIRFESHTARRHS